MAQMYNIFNGWYNLITDNKPAFKLAKTRALICFKCEHKKDNQFIEIFVNDKMTEIKGSICGICTCPLSAKLRSPNEKCDKKLW